jgi:hypothetical protein
MRAFLLACAFGSMVGIPALATSARAQDDVPVFSLPLGVGFRIPSYDRVNGLSLPWGPVITIPPGRIEINPVVTYRSNLGEIDPSVGVRAAFGSLDTLSLFIGRGTFTNDAWIRTDLINSLAAIGVGSDARNYFRAKRATAEYSHSFRTNTFVWAPMIGALHEIDWSTGIATRHNRAPWSIFGRTDTLKMRRINPAIAPGHVTSGLVGVRGKYEQNELTGSFSVNVERSFDEPASGSNDHFTQGTFDARANFPTFGMQSFEFRGHAVSSGGPTPPQRFAYLGGAGTLATVDLLALGGDRLVFVEGEYYVPLVRPLLPFVGAPVLSARYAAGSAGVGSLPDFIQNIGVGIGVKLVKAEYHIDPNYRKTPYTRKHAFSIGFSLSL